MISIIQPALPSYRIDFFERLAQYYGTGIVVYYSNTDLGVLTRSDRFASWQQPIGPMLYPIRGVEWQVGALSVPFRRGDTVVVCGAPRNLSTLLVLAKARMKGARTIWWGQYWSATSEARRHPLRMKLSRMADALLFYTDSEVTQFQADGWTHSGPVGALNNGIDLTEVYRLRRTYKPAQRKKNLLFIGRLTKKAQLCLMVSALSDPRLSDCHLHVIGNGPEENSLHVQARDIGVADRIIWHGGTTNETCIAQVANDCAAFVYPGSVGLSLIHAMGYGLPCIVHDQPLRHMPEIAAFEDGGSGMTFCEGDATDLAKAVSSMLSTSNDRERMSLRSCVITRDNYTTEGMATRFVEFLNLMNEREKETFK